MPLEELKKRTTFKGLNPMASKTILGALQRRQSVINQAIKFWLILNNKNSLDSLDFCAQRKETNIIYNMTRKLYIESLICTLQNMWNTID